MVTVLRLGLKGEVCGVLEGSVVPQGELDCTAVHTRAQAVSTCEALDPSDATEKLALNGARSPRIGMVLV